MNIAVTGSTGFIGSALCGALEERGQRVVRMVRRPVRPGEDAIRWDPAAQMIDAAGLAGIDAVVHLAGEPIAGRWTPEKKRRIRASRVEGTRLLAEALAAVRREHGRPAALVSASAIGYYGDRGAEPLTEESPPGTGFLAEVARDWEAATGPAAGAGIRVVLARTALVLGPGGVLAQLLPVFRLGFGGRLGRGDQYWSWIARPDHVRVLLSSLDNPALAGPIAAASPRPVTNREFTAVLARLLRRPAIFPVPRIAARLVLGEVADSAYQSARVLPARLEAAGFAFDFPELEPALREALRGLNRPLPRST